MIKGTEKIRQFLVFNKSPFWNIKRSETGAIVFSSTTESGKGNKELTVDEGLRYFDDCQFLLEPGHYFIEAWTKDTPTNSRFKDQVIIGNEKTSTSIGAMGAGMYSEEMIEKRITDGIEKYQKEQELKALHKRLEELEKNDNDQALASFLNKVEPYLHPMLSGIFGNGKQAVLPMQNVNAISGIGNTDNSETMTAQEQAKQRFQQALNKWNSVEPNIIEIVEKIADMAARKDAMYMMVKSQLLKKG